MTDRFAFVPGALVRLRLDSGPLTYGVVVAAPDERPTDGVLMVPVKWVDDREEAEWYANEVAQDWAYGVGAPAEAHERVQTLAATTLAPLCEHTYQFADEWAMACSEPGMRTTLVIPCGYDATQTVGATDPHGGEFSWNLCDGHAAEFRSDLAAEAAASIE